MKLSVLIRSVDDIEKVARLGFEGVELAVDAFGQAAAGPLDDAAPVQARQLCARHDVEITALSYHAMAIHPPPAGLVTTAYERVFAAAEALGVHTVASLSGFIRALHEHRDRIYYVRAKHTDILPEQRYRVGLNGASTEKAWSLRPDPLSLQKGGSMRR